MKLDNMRLAVRTANALSKCGFKTAGQVIDVVMQEYDYPDNAFTLLDGLMRLPGIGRASATNFMQCLLLYPAVPLFRRYEKKP